MANTREPRFLTCQKTGKQFTYAGVGRPPKYHPAIQAEVRAGQRKAAQKAKREAAKAEKVRQAAQALAA